MTELNGEIYSCTVGQALYFPEKLTMPTTRVLHRRQTPLLLEEGIPPGKEYSFACISNVDKTVRK